MATTVDRFLFPSKGVFLTTSVYPKPPESLFFFSRKCENCNLIKQPPPVAPGIQEKKQKNKKIHDLGLRCLDFFRKYFRQKRRCFYRNTHLNTFTSTFTRYGLRVYRLATLKKKKKKKMTSLKKGGGVLSTATSRRRRCFWSPAEKRGTAGLRREDWTAISRR